jgi:hypothetical protein
MTALDELRSDPGDRRHGTYYGYVLGCRCARCRAANTAYKAARPVPHARIRARERALRELGRRHREELAQLLEKFLEQER